MRFVTLATKPNDLVLVAALDTRDPAPDGNREVPVDRLRRQVFLLRELGSGTRGTAEELFDDLGTSPAT